MSHCDTVADGDGVEFERYTACLSNGVFDDGGDFIQVYVSGYDVAVTVGDADEGLADVFVFKTAGPEQTSVGGPLEAFFYCVTSHTVLQKSNLLYYLMYFYELSSSHYNHGPIVYKLENEKTGGLPGQKAQLAVDMGLSGG